LHPRCRLRVSLPALPRRREVHVLISCYGPVMLRSERCGGWSGRRLALPPADVHGSRTSASITVWPAATAAVTRCRPSRTWSMSPTRVRRTGGASRPSSSHVRYSSIFASSRPRPRRRISASGTNVVVSDASSGERLLPRGRMRCGRVESNHHSQRRRGYSAAGSPVPSVRRKVDRSDFEPTLLGSRPRVLAVTPCRPRKVEPAPAGFHRGEGRLAAPSSYSGGTGGFPRRPPPIDRAAGRIRTDTAGITTQDACPYTTTTMDCAGGIRTRDLELMRLARTASSSTALHRCARSTAPEAPPAPGS
jgi:hypothetical protein